MCEALDATSKAEVEEISRPNTDTPCHTRTLRLRGFCFASRPG